MPNTFVPPERGTVQERTSVMSRYERYTLQEIKTILSDAMQQVPAKLRYSARFELQEDIDYDGDAITRLYLAWQRPQTDAEWEASKQRAEREHNIGQASRRAMYEQLKKEFDK